MGGGKSTFPPLHGLGMRLGLSLAERTKTLFKRPQCERHLTFKQGLTIVKTSQSEPDSLAMWSQTFRYLLYCSQCGYWAPWHGGGAALMLLSHCLVGWRNVMEMVLERSACIPTCEDAQANTACNRVRRLIKCTISKLSVFYWRLSTFHVLPSLSS